MSKKITVSKAIREALHEEMVRDDKVFIMGEDMAVTPSGGVSLRDPRHAATER